MTKEMMEEKLYQRMQEENQKFLAELREQTTDDVITHAYEIACRDNILMLFEDETGLTPQQLNALLRFEHPLAELYDDWIKRETSEMDNFRSSIECCANDAIRRDKERERRRRKMRRRGRAYAVCLPKQLNRASEVNLLTDLRCGEPHKGGWD